MKVRFSSQSNLGSWLIRHIIKSEWSHVEFVLDNGNTIGARFFGGVRERKPIKYKACKDFDIPEIQLGDIGSTYDYLALLGSLFHTYLQKEDWYQCSEYVAKQLMDHNLIDIECYHLMEPDDLYEIIKKMGDE